MAGRPWVALYEGEGPVDRGSRSMVDRLLEYSGAEPPGEIAWVKVPVTKVVAARRLAPELRDELRAMDPARVLTLGSFALMCARGDDKKPVLADERGRAQWLPVAKHGDALLVPTIPTKWVYADPEYWRDFARDVMKWGTAERPFDLPYPDFFLPTDAEGVMRALRALDAFSVVSVDIETDGLDPLRNEVLSVGVGATTGPVLVVPRELMGDEAVKDALWSALWEDPLRRVVLHNGKFDLKFLARWWGDLPTGDDARLGDTMLMSHLLDERPARSKYRAHGLKDLARVRYDVEDYSFDHDGFQARLRGEGEPLTEDDWEQFYAYHAMDLRVTAVLWSDLAREAAEESEGLLRCHDDLLMPATLALAEAELRGVPVDHAFVASERRRLERRIERRHRALIGFLRRRGEPEDFLERLKPTAPSQFVDVVMRVFGVQHSRKKGFRSIADAGMAQYAKYTWDATGHGHTPEDREKPVYWPNVGDKKGAQRGTYVKPLTPTDIGDMRALIVELLGLGRRHEARWIAAVLEQRLDMKYLSTYIEGFETGVGPDDRVHADFNIAGTVTGRLSSSNPNLHAIPKRGQLTPFRRSVAARPGWTLIEADYSQLELRVAAMLSGDAALTQTYVENRDLHLEVASLMLGKPPEEISEPERYLAKAVDFGVIYGRGASAIAKGDAMFYFSHVLGGGEPWTIEETADFIQRFLDGYPDLRDWLDRVGDEMLETRLVETPFGRRRRFIILENVKRQLADADRRREGLGRSGQERLNQKGVSAKVRTMLRQAVNTPIQSMASDICLSAFSRLVRELDPGTALPVSLVHDSILVEAREEVWGEIADTMKEVMERSPVDTRGVPLAVDVQVGPNLAEMRKVKQASSPGDEGESPTFRNSGSPAARSPTPRSGRP